MVNYVNYSTRYFPSVHYGRANIWNSYENHAMSAYNSALSNPFFYKSYLPEINSSLNVTGYSNCFNYYPFFCANPISNFLGFGLGLLGNWFC